MEVTLTPELEQRLERRLSGGRWHTPSEVLETALDILDDMDEWIVMSREELDAKLEESLASAQRGETVSAEDAKAHLAKLREAL
jgi:Arc/MetJ-type ribon-helix-helix transcriptional regulator